MNKDHDMSSELLTAPAEMASVSAKGTGKDARPASIFSQPRNFLGNRFVYVTISPRARGLSVGVNVNPDRKCNFDCVYCEVDRTLPVEESVFDCDIAAEELQNVLRLVHSGKLRDLPAYRALPAELLELRHLALSGDGEPTISPKFLEAVEMAVHVRALGSYPFFKIVLITNGSGLDREEVQVGLSLLTPRDEVWVKLDAGSQKTMDVVNRSEIPYEKILDNIVMTGRRRRIVIQSIFCQIDGQVPTHAQILEYALQLRDLKDRGAQISLVQIYSATRPTASSIVRHLPLKLLSDIAETVRAVAGLKAEPF